MRRALLTALLLTAAALAPGPAAAATVRVTTPGELSGALAAAAPGDVIQLGPGGYGPVEIRGRGGPAADLTLSASPAHPSRG